MAELEPFVDADDIAAVAIDALTGDGHAGVIHELTGPRLLRFDERRHRTVRATGRRIQFVSATPEEYAAVAVDHGVPPEEVAALTDLFTRVLDGRNAFVTDGVEQCWVEPAGTSPTTPERRPPPASGASPAGAE